MPYASYNPGQVITAAQAEELAQRNWYNSNPGYSAFMFDPKGATALDRLFGPSVYDGVRQSMMNNREGGSTEVSSRPRTTARLFDITPEDFVDPTTGVHHVAEGGAKDSGFHIQLQKNSDGTYTVQDSDYSGSYSKQKARADASESKATMGALALFAVVTGGLAAAGYTGAEGTAVSATAFADPVVTAATTSAEGLTTNAAGEITLTNATSGIAGNPATYMPSAAADTAAAASTAAETAGAAGAASNATSGVAGDASTYMPSTAADATAAGAPANIPSAVTQAAKTAGGNPVWNAAKQAYDVVGTAGKVLSTVNTVGQVIGAVTGTNPVTGAQTGPNGQPITMGGGVGAGGTTINVGDNGGAATMASAAGNVLGAFYQAGMTSKAADDVIDGLKAGQLTYDDAQNWAAKFRATGDTNVANLISAAALAGGERLSAADLAAGAKLSAADLSAASKMSEGAFKAAAAANAGQTAALGEAQNVLSQQQALQQPFYQAGTAALQQLQEGLKEGGQFNRQFSMADAQNMDAYRFALQEGKKAIDNTAAARTGLLNSGNVKDNITFAEGTAAQFQQQAFNQWMSQNNLTLGGLQNLVATGQVSADQLQSALAQYGVSAETIQKNIGTNNANAETQSAYSLAQGDLNSAGHLAQGDLSSAAALTNAGNSSAAALAAAQKSGAYAMATGMENKGTYGANTQIAIGNTRGARDTTIGNNNSKVISGVVNAVTGWALNALGKLIPDSNGTAPYVESQVDPSVVPSNRTTDGTEPSLPVSDRTTTYYGGGPPSDQPTESGHQSIGQPPIDSSATSPSHSFDYNPYRDPNSSMYSGSPQNTTQPLNLGVTSPTFGMDGQFNPQPVTDTNMVWDV